MIWEPTEPLGPSVKITEHQSACFSCDHYIKVRGPGKRLEVQQWQGRPDTSQNSRTKQQLSEERLIQWMMTMDLTLGSISTPSCPFPTLVLPSSTALLQNSQATSWKRRKCRLNRKTLHPHRGWPPPKLVLAIEINEANCNFFTSHFCSEILCSIWWPAWGPRTMQGNLL